MTGIERLVDIVNDGPYSGGMIHISVQKLREICEQIEAEAGVETVKPEAMEALAFVEEHGGIEVIKERLLETIPHAVYDRIYRRKHRRIRELENELEDMRGRLMPEGIKWPMFEDNELVGFGDEYVNAKGNVSTLRTIVIKDCRDRLGGGYYWKLGKGACAVVVKNGERIKRPPVLAADGEPLEVGQTVWHEETGRGPWVVVRASNGQATVDEKENVTGTYDGNMLTHQRPVLDAYGVPIREGDTVWHIKTGREYVVVEPSYGETVVVRLAKYDDAEGEQHAPDQLTHTKPEPPDSAERIAEDIMRMAEEWCSYPTLWEASEKAASSVGEATMGLALRSLSKRCRAVAERESGE